MDDTTSATGNGEFADEMSDTFQTMREEFDEVDRRLRELVKERPLACLLGAVLGGYAIARLIR